MPPVISLKHIRFTQGDTFTLSVDALTLQPGLIYALTGPNGSGKSTLLRLMALLISPQEGTIVITGDPLVSKARQRQSVTLVDQSPYLLKGSVYDNLNYGLKLRSVESHEGTRRIKAALANVGLSGFERRRAQELSGGEVQRVALARALVVEPTLLLLDEPTANIDSNSLESYEELLRRLPEYGVTVMFSTHDPSQARRLGDTILRIDKGCLVNDPDQGSLNPLIHIRSVADGTKF